MHAKKLLHRILKKTCPDMHKKRFESLEVCSQALLEGQVLTVTEIGRSIKSQARVKHNIKRADRLLSNPHLLLESGDIYKSLGAIFIEGIVQPLILIDWSDLTPTRTHFLLRASLAVHGRPLLLYEEVHTELDNQETHRKFLKKLKDILGPDVTPILVADAGFRVNK